MSFLTSSCHNRDVPRPQFEVGHVAARERSRNKLNLWRSKQNRCTCTCRSCGHCNIYDNLLKWHRDCWALHTKWYPSVRIDEENPSYTWTWEQVKWRSMSKQNGRWTSTSWKKIKIKSTSCWHCNACMVICWKGIAFAGRCTQSGTNQWGSTKKIRKLNTTSGRGYMEVKVKTK